VVNHRLGLHKSFKLFVKGLVDLAEVQFLRTVWHGLQVDEVPVRHVVGAFENLVLLQIHLECRLVWKVVQSFLKFDKLLDTREAALHSVKRLVNCAVYLQQLARRYVFGVAAHGVVVGRV